MTQSRDPFANGRAVYLKVVVAIHELENGDGDNPFQNRTLNRSNKGHKSRLDACGGSGLWQR